VSKEHRPDPIVQTRLLVDTKGIPIMYDLSSGNTNDCSTLMPIPNKVKETYKIGRTIVVVERELILRIT
jgi:transposase